MNSQVPIQSETTPSILAELIVQTDLNSINQALAENGVAADHIVSILPLAGSSMVNAQAPRVRILYRT